MKKDCWNRCDICGKFISYNDFPDLAKRIFALDYKCDEVYETFHIKCEENIILNVKRMQLEGRSKDANNQLG